jgi:hypothetical protein
MRLVQLIDDQQVRRVAIVEEPNLVFLDRVGSIYELANLAMDSNESLVRTAGHLASDQSIAYDPVYSGTSAWQLLPCFDHPHDPMHCMISGTGLTHKASANNRQKMHDAEANSAETDSMKMYRMGEAGGRPAPGTIGAQPEWFYKGNGMVLKAHNEPLEIPSYAEDGGEEPEVAGLYLCDQQGIPYRIGFATANEFSDHVMEKRNYLYLAPSKLRSCSLGPELVLESEFSDIGGTVSIFRHDQVIWTRQIRTGEEHIVHSLTNLEYHHFKYSFHRLPQMVHIHFFGADAFSFGEGIALAADDIMQIQWQGFGRPLRNPLKISADDQQIFEISSL